MATADDYARLGAWAAILNPDKDIDRRSCTRTVPMRILSLGAPRTATLSMCEAYQILGYDDTYHYSSIFANVRDADMWLDALDAKFNPRSCIPPFGRAEFDKLLGHCMAVTDVPCIIFWRELLEAYPEAKVVLVQRDERRWLESIRILVSGILNPLAQCVLRFTDPYRIGRILTLGRSWIKYWFGVHGHLSVAAAMLNAPATYTAHYDAIRETVPSARLLEYQMGSGWEPLCDFLGTDVPDVPFPNRNDAQMLEASFDVVLVSALRRSLANVGLIAALGAVGVAVVWRGFVSS